MEEEGRTHPADDSAFQQFIDNAFGYQQEFKSETNGEMT